MREIKFRNMVYREQHKDWVTYFYTLQDLVENSDMEVFEDVWEQYTGLKDKNGKEIYEGDIIGVYQEYTNLEGDKTWEELEPWGEVIYNSEQAMFGVWALAPFEGEGMHFFEFGEEGATGLEVIGNIHENPELLEGKK